MFIYCSSFLCIIIGAIKSRSQQILRMNTHRRISEELEDLCAHHHITQVTETSNQDYLLLYNPKQIQCPYSSRTFRLQLALQDSYPQSPPSLKFLDSIYHLNVSPTSGEVRIAVVEDDWSPFLSLTSVIESLDRVMETPEEDYPADSDILYCFKYKKQQYYEKAKTTISVPLLHQQNQSSPEKVIQDYEEIEIYDSLENLEKQFNTFDEIPEREEEQVLFPEMENVTINQPKIQIEHKPMNSQNEGIVIMSQKRSTNTARSFTKRQNLSPTDSKGSPTEQNSKCLKSPRVLRINETVSVFIEQINELQKQIDEVKNNQMRKLLETARDNNVELLKQLLAISEQAKKKAVESIRKQISDP